MSEKRASRPKSKKWARRRKVAFVLHTDGGWHKTYKISWDDYDIICRAADASNQTLEEFMLEAIERYVGC